MCLGFMALHWNSSKNADFMFHEALQRHYSGEMETFTLFCGIFIPDTYTKFYQN